jgi:hypothetical protein
LFALFRLPIAQAKYGCAHNEMKANMAVHNEMKAKMPLLLAPPPGKAVKQYIVRKGWSIYR